MEKKIDSIIDELCKADTFLTTTVTGKLHYTACCVSGADYMNSLSILHGHFFFSFLGLAIS